MTDSIKLPNDANAEMAQRLVRLMDEYMGDNPDKYEEFKYSVNGLREALAHALLWARPTEQSKDTPCKHPESVTCLLDEQEDCDCRCAVCHYDGPGGDHPEGCECGGFDRNGSHAAGEYVGYCARQKAAEQANGPMPPTDAAVEIAVNTIRDAVFDVTGDRECARLVVKRLRGDTGAFIYADPAI